nr:hypothetical protein [Tanacetum cinerariifolium]
MMTGHSQKWHDGSLSQSICGSNNSEGMAPIASKLDNLGRDIKLKETVYANQVGFHLCRVPHLDKECALDEEIKSMEEIKQPPNHYGWGKYQQPHHGVILDTAKQLEDIHNFKQDGEETLYQAWERYNDLLYKCPTHDINSHQKVNIFYNSTSTINCQLLDSHGPILGMAPAEGLTAIQMMTGHSQKWHDGSLSQSICGSNNSEGMAPIASKLDNLGRDIKLKETVYAIQVGFHLCGVSHLDKECALDEEIKSIEEIKYREFGRSFPNDNRVNEKFCGGVYGYGSQPPLGDRKSNLTEKFNKYIEEMAKRHAEQDEWLKKL